MNPIAWFLAWGLVFFAGCSEAEDAKAATARWIKQGCDRGDTPGFGNDDSRFPHDPFQTVYVENSNGDVNPPLIMHVCGPTAPSEEWTLAVQRWDSSDARVFAPLAIDWAVGEQTPLHSITCGASPKAVTPGDAYEDPECTQLAGGQHVQVRLRHTPTGFVLLF